MNINGTEIDFSKQRGYFFHGDCLEGLKQMPDKSVSLAIVDPPYGAGFTEGGGCQGWFSKYHQDEKPTDNKELGVHFHGRGRSKRYQEAYNENSSQFCNVERESRTSRSGTGLAADSTDTRIWRTSDKTRWGGNFDKYKEQAEHGLKNMPKKSFRGTRPRKKSIFKSFFVSHGIK